MLGSGLEGYSEELTTALSHAGVMWNGVPAVKAGAIIIGLIWGAALAFIIDKRLDKTAIILFIGAILSLFGFIHRAALGFAWNSPFTWSYIIAAALSFVLWLGRNSWFKAQDDFDYV